MEKQLDLFKSAEARNKGMQRALETTESKIEKWGTIAYNFLLQYVKTNKEFLAEDVRVASQGIVPEPISKRAWGSIFVLAKKNNLIKRIGYSAVKNPKAHRTPATLWSVC